MVDRYYYSNNRQLYIVYAIIFVAITMIEQINADLWVELERISDMQQVKE
jgi:hypothetical protein